MSQVELKTQPNHREGIVDDLRRRIEKFEGEPYPRVNKELHLLRKTMILEKKIMKAHDEDSRGSFRIGHAGRKLIIWNFEANKWSGRLLITENRKFIKEATGSKSAEEMLRILLQK